MVVPSVLAVFRSALSPFGAPRLFFSVSRLLFCRFSLNASFRTLCFACLAESKRGVEKGFENKTQISITIIIFEQMDSGISTFPPPAPSILASLVDRAKAARLAGCTRLAPAGVDAWVMVIR